MTIDQRKALEGNAIEIVAQLTGTEETVVRAIVRAPLADESHPLFQLRYHYDTVLSLLLEQQGKLEYVRKQRDGENQRANLAELQVLQLEARIAAATGHAEQMRVTIREMGGAIAAVTAAFERSGVFADSAPIKAINITGCVKVADEERG